MQPSEEAIAQCHKLWRELWLEWWNGGKPDYSDAYGESLNQTEKILKLFVSIDVAPLEEWVTETKQKIAKAHEFVQTCGLFDGTDAGKDVIETAVKYGQQFKAERDQLRAELDQKDKRLRELLREIAEHAHDWKTLRQHMECDGSDLPQLMKAWDDLKAKLAELDNSKEEQRLIAEGIQETSEREGRELRDKLRQQIAELEQWIRVRIWSSHGCVQLYGDDGELQCEHGDLKRMPFNEVLMIDANGWLKRFNDNEKLKAQLADLQQRYDILHDQRHEEKITDLTATPRSGPVAPSVRE